MPFAYSVINVRLQFSVAALYQNREPMLSAILTQKWGDSVICDTHDVYDSIEMPAYNR